MKLLIILYGKKKKSMDEELKAQIDKNTWEMVIPPEGVNIVGSKWTYCLEKE